MRSLSAVGIECLSFGLPKTYPVLVVSLNGEENSSLLYTSSAEVVICIILRITCC